MALSAKSGAIFYTEMNKINHVQYIKIACQKHSIQMTTSL